MRNLLPSASRVAVVVLGVTAAAHAAPSAPDKPGPLDPKVVRPGPVLAVKRIDFEVVASLEKCGEPATVTVRLTNKLASAWSGDVVLGVGGNVKKTPVSLLGNASKDVTVTHGTIFDCKKPLPNLELSVTSEPNDTALVTKTLKPTKVAASSGFNMPPATTTPPPVWLRRVELEGACGAPLTARAHLMYTPPSGTTQEQPGKITFSSNGETRTVSATVPPNQVTVVKHTFSPTIECASSSGLPGYDYVFESPSVPQSGRLNVQTVAYTP